MKKIISIIIALVVIGGGVWYLAADSTAPDHDGHGGELVAKEPVRADGSFTIVTSFYPLAFALETLTEGVASVTNIGEGRDPHDVQLSTANVRDMEQADLVVLQGAGLEPWTEDIKNQLEREDVPVLLVTDTLELREGGHSDDHDDHADEHAEDEHHDEHGREDDTPAHDDHDHEDGHEEHNHEEADHTHSEEEHDEHGHDEHEDEHHEHDHGAYDPHTWLDPVLFSNTVGELVEALSTLDPENASLYEERGNTLQAELAALDNAYETRLATCTYDEVITSHDAFSYLGARYGFTIHAIAGLSTQDQPSAQTLANLREEAEEGVGAILLEQNSVAAYGETLASETGLRTLSINPIAYAIPDGENYLTMMERNLDAFADALQCN
jgi:zinc transport system substrate-binding protein